MAGQHHNRAGPGYQHVGFHNAITKDSATKDEDWSLDQTRRIFYNKCCTATQWTNEGQAAVKWPRLSEFNWARRA
jgi:hypothetical protein